MSHLSYNTLRSLATRALGHGGDKGGDEGRDKGGNGFSKMPINRGFVRVEGGDEGLFSNHSLFFNNLPLLFNTRALLRIA